MREVFGPGSPPLRGQVVLPGDKSLSHRAVLFSAMARGRSSVQGILDSADVRATIGAVSALGARVELTATPDGSLAGDIDGWGSAGPKAPFEPIDCGNSGTTARLLLGVLAGWPVTATLIGDSSLNARPMLRVTEPLTRMGASFESAEGGTLPVTVHGSSTLRPIAYDSPVASAQVKTALLLAGLRAAGGVSVTEPAPSRDHTERLLPAYGVSVDVDPRHHSASVCGPVVPTAAAISIPGDPSSAAFVVAAALVVPGSDVLVSGVSLNETRIGFLRVLERMGADIMIERCMDAGTEPVGSIRARHSRGLTAVIVTAEEVPSLVDEIPILALTASQAEGTTRFEGVGELRVKESDRLAAVARGLEALGVVTRAGEDWLEVEGKADLDGCEVDSLGDHRLAMTWAVAGLVANGPVAIDRFEAVGVSYPSFARDIRALAE